MDYKKEYEAMVQRVRELHEGGNALTKLQMEIVCPELTESEDEKIRKEILDFIQLCLSRIDFGSRSIALRKEDTEMFNKWIAYLEKQKVNTDGDFARGYDCGYECCLNSHGAEWFEKQKEIPAGWGKDERTRVLLDEGGATIVKQTIADTEQKVHELLYAPKQCVHTPREIDFADKYSHQVWEKLMAKFGAIEGYRIGANDVSDIVLNAILNTFKFVAEQKPDYCHHEVDLSVCSEEYRKGYYDGWNNCNQQYSQLEAEQNPAESTEDSVKFEEGFKAGRESGLRDGQKYVLDNLDSYGLCKSAEWSEEEIDKVVVYLHERDGGMLWSKAKEIASDICDILHPQPKQEWSEEDERIRGHIIDVLTYYAENHSALTMAFIKRDTDWLKSLPMRCPKKTE